MTPQGSDPPAPHVTNREAVGGPPPTNSPAPHATNRGAVGGPPPTNSPAPHVTKRGAVGGTPPTLALVGPMGAGKSKVGAILAERLSRPLVDTDEIVEEVAGMPIPAIFEREGEEGFRALEAGAVRQAAAVPGAVIACGGGAVLDPANVHVLRRAGLVVYLRVPPEVAAARVGDGEDRPLLAGGDPAARLAAVIGERKEAYEGAAHLVVDATGSAEEVASAILHLIEATA